MIARPALAAAVVVTLVATAIAAAATPTVRVSESDRSAARLGAGWLARTVPGGGDGQSADTAVALRATGRLGPSARAARAAALRAGAAGYATTPGAAAKVALGLVALGDPRPRCAGAIDLVARMRAGARNGRYGTTIFDQTLTMLATRALGRPADAAAVRWLRGARGAGGWNVVAGQVDDVSSTAIAVLALRAAGASADDGDVRAGLRWIEARRGPAGGFALGRDDRVESNSTALAIQAAASVGRRDGRAVRALRGLQRSDGSFNYTAAQAGSKVIASTDAVVALAGAAMPVAMLARPAPACT